MVVWNGFWRQGGNMLRVMRKSKRAAFSATSCYWRCLSSNSEANVVKSPYADVAFPDISLVEFIWKMAEKVPNKTAMICGITGRSYTYGESRILARRFAASLRKAGFGNGDVLAVVMPNTPEYPLVFFGAMEAGLTVTTVNPIYSAEEIKMQLLDSAAKGVVTVPEVYSTVCEAVKLTKKKLPIITTPGTVQDSLPQGAIDFREMIQSNIDTSNLSGVDGPYPSDIAVLPYSSGTTGLPKGVKLSHKHLITNCLQLCKTPEICTLQPATEEFQDVLPAILPFYHIYGMVSLAIDSLHFGSKIVTLPKFDPASFLKNLVEQKASILLLVPPLIQFLGSHPEVKPSHLEHLRCITNGAAPVGLVDIQRLLDKAPHLLFTQGYGLTETSPVISISEPHGSKLTSCGKPIANTEMKVINRETGESLRKGEKGEVCARGPQVMLGYHNNPKATAETIDSSGWLHTGDVGYYDEDGDFYIVDRYKELIKVKGLQVAPAELEEVLRGHPEILDAAVIGIQDQRCGEVPRAYVVPKNSNLKEDDIKAFVAKKVAEHKHLQGGVEFVSSIPKNPSGKILRRKIKEMYEHKH